MRVRTQHLGVRLVGIGALLGAIAVTAGPAAAQRTVIQADGAVNVGYTQTTRGTFQADPNAQPADIHDGTLGGFFTELRPDIAIQTGTPRLTWRAGYQFSGNLSLTGEQLGNYSNSGNVSLAAELTKFTTLTLSAAGSQGGTSFLLAQRPADAGNPELRAPDSPNLVSGTVVESLGWEVGRHLAIQQNLIASTSAPQDHLDQRNSAVSATLSLDRVYARDSYGLEARAGISWLRPLRADLEPYQTMTSALVARYNRDFTENWNGLLTAGMEQVYTDTGSQPLAFLPTASASVRYALYNAVAALDFTHGTATNLQVGAVSLTDKITARGIITLDPREVRALSFSAGVLHNEPLGEVDSVVAAGTGNAFQGDAGFTTAISQNILFSARYSVAYQFDQGANLAPTLVHIALVGVTATYKNTERTTRPVPKRGRRVDGTDAEGFPVIDEPPTP
jgi:hypothetical protein